MGLYLDIELCSSYHVPGLVDTGANITLIRTESFFAIPDEERPVLEPVTCDLMLANGKTIPIAGTTYLVLKVASKKLKHKIWIADIEPELILGYDFLEKFHCILDICNSIILVNGERVESQLHSGQKLGQSRVTTRKTVVIPPCSEMLMVGQLTHQPESRKCGLIQPNEQFSKKKGVAVAYAVVNTQNSEVPLRVVNTLPEPVTVHENTTVAYCEPLDEVDETNTNQQRFCVGNNGMDTPPHLRDLIDRSCIRLEEKQRQELVSLITQYGHVFSKGPSDMGRTKVVQHTINTGSHAPIKQAPRRVPISRREEITNHLNEMLANDVVEPSCSPWASPIVLVGKKDGSTRFCVDYRKLNDITVKDSYPLPKIDETLDMMGGSRWFSTLDLASGYWQIEMAAADRPKTAFVTHQGLFQFKVLPFGLCNAPATFERLMEFVLAGLQWSTCLIYLDDVIVHSHDFSAHIQRLAEVLQRFEQAGLKLSPKKCHLLQKEVEYLGHRITPEGISTDPEKIRAIRNWPVPQNLTEVRSFLGLCAYYRRFIKDFANIAKPLHRLTEKNKRFNWTEETQLAFQKLKTALTEAPVLSFPLPKGQFIIDADASNHGLGAVLSQEQNGIEKPVSYYSRTLSKAEEKYCVTRKELLAVVSAVKRFHHYVYGRHFLLRTDHGALRWLLNFKNPEGQVARWIEILNTYDMGIRHRPGRSHGNADALSRRPCGDCAYCIRQEEKEDRTAETRNELAANSPKCCTLDTQEVKDVTKESKSWMEQWSLQELRQMQVSDPEIQPIIAWKEQSTMKPAWEVVAGMSNAIRNYWLKWGELALWEGVLYRKFQADEGVIWWQLVVPKSIRVKILQQVHDHKLVGHLQIRKTLERLRPKFYWSGYRKEVEEYCNDCQKCASRKGAWKKPRAGMQTYIVGTPMLRCALDIMGPLPMSYQGNKYILVVADYFTKWTEAFAMPDQEASTVADILVKQFICRFGIPQELHSDQGRQFESLLFQEMCKLLDIEKTRTTAFHPQSDGMVERFNRTLEDMLALVVEPNQKDWDTWLPYLMLAYRSAIHESTGYTPSELMLGRTVTLPYDGMVTAPPVEEDMPKSYPEYITKLRDTFEKVHNGARKHLRIPHERQRKDYNRKAHLHQYKVGDCVWLRSPGRKKGLSPKLQAKWKGPCLIEEKLSDVTYRIKEGPRTKSKVVHHNRLKPHKGSSKPMWMTSQNKTFTSKATQAGETHLKDNDIAVSESEPTTPDQPIPDSKVYPNLHLRPRRQRKPPDHYGSNIYE
ncbi:hypothetical protein HOLleu_18285 [Holothuria leucospilota]|uniref:Endonuclease n=1 Tax=Holothuria leucospilota TaxID=206669 RepID=A0A9Q1H9I4_HOLLE|nr:hypothetical protein HOLleu_18285 [Holothuria leucospilota]